MFAGPILFNCKLCMNDACLNGSKTFVCFFEAKFARDSKIENHHARFKIILSNPAQYHYGAAKPEYHC